MSLVEGMARAIYEKRQEQWRRRWPDMPELMSGWDVLADATKAEYVEQAQAAVCVRLTSLGSEGSS